MVAIANSLPHNKAYKYPGEKEEEVDIGRSFNSLKIIKDCSINNVQLIIVADHG